MGLRAIRLCIKEISIFKSQLMGILRASAYGPLQDPASHGLRRGRSEEGKGGHPRMHG